MINKKNLYIFSIIYFIVLISFISFSTVKKDFLWLDPVSGVDNSKLLPLFSHISNDGNIIAGYYTYKDAIFLAALYNNQKINKLESLGGLENCIFKGSENNLLVGWSTDEKGKSIPVIWDISGKITKLMNYEGKALAISYNGNYVSGWYYNELNEFTPFIYDTNQKDLKEINNLTFGNYQEAYSFGINDNKNLCGYLLGSEDSAIPFVYINNKIIVPSGVKEGKFYQLSNNNTAVGYIINKNNDKRNAVIFENNNLKNIFDENVKSVAYSISKDGKAVVGYFADPNDNNYEKPFLYVNNKIIDIEKEFKSYLDKDSFLIEAQGISSNGEYLVGIGFNSKNYSYQIFITNISKFTK